ncbi:MAG TPA: DoxX family protein [Rhizomicrobium sp.]|jgi:putative oxidoreductase|nr:DoxX family protein [Rhizomicrobium sp.]
MNSTTLASWAPRVLSVLRIVTALLFLEHGLMKLIGFPAPIPGVPHPLPLLLQLAMWLETIGPPLLLIGLFTRPVAFLLSGEMAVAYFMAHAPRGPYPALNMGEPAALYCFIFLFLFFAGPGPWSVDAQLNKTAADSFAARKAAAP